MTSIPAEAIPIEAEKPQSRAALISIEFLKAAEQLGTKSDDAHSLGELLFDSIVRNADTAPQREGVRELCATK